MTRAPGEPLRVLHFPLPTAGHPSGLAQAERRAGLDSELVSLQSTPYGFAADQNLGLESKPAAVRLFRRLLFGLSTLGRYDVYHFNTGQTFFPLRVPVRLDLPLLKALGKKVFVTFQGCDARQRSFCRRAFALSCASGPRPSCPCLESLDGPKARRIRYLKRWADGVFCLNPDLLRVVAGAELVPYASVDAKRLEPSYPDSSASGPLRILHAPTDRAKKGTEAVLEARDRLRGELDLEWQLVEGLCHSEAMAWYRSADLVIDQLRIGWYGGLAVEAMALGKPVIAYLRESDLELVPAGLAADLPVVSARPDNLVSVIRTLASDRERLQRLGAAGREFVLRWHDPDRIAARFAALYRGRARRFWHEKMPQGV